MTSVSEALRTFLNKLETERYSSIAILREAIPLAEAQERELAELTQSRDEWKRQSLALVTLLRAKVNDATWETLSKTWAGAEFEEKEREIARLREALEPLLDICEYVYLNIPLPKERQDQIVNSCCAAKAALHPTPEPEAAQFCPMLPHEQPCDCGLPTKAEPEAQAKA